MCAWPHELSVPTPPWDWIVVVRLVYLTYIPGIHSPILGRYRNGCGALSVSTTALPLTSTFVMVGFAGWLKQFVPAVSPLPHLNRSGTVPTLVVKCDAVGTLLELSVRS